MIFAASKALTKAVNEDEVKAGDLYARIERIRSVSAHVAAALIHQAAADGLIEDPEYLKVVGPVESNQEARWFIQ